MSKIESRSIKRLGAAFVMASGMFVADAFHSTVQADNCHFVQSGTASWYGKDFDGRKMANGKRFNRFANTVAHRTLAKGTKVRIERKADDGRILNVNATVTDRGPYKGKRIVDVSEGIADQLQMKNKGLSNVTVMRCD